MAGFDEAVSRGIRSMGLPPGWPQVSGPQAPAAPPDLLDEATRAAQQAIVDRQRMSALARSERDLELRAETDQLEAEARRLENLAKTKMFAAALSPQPSGPDPIVAQLMAANQALQDHLARMQAAQAQSLASELAAMRADMNKPAPPPPTFAEQLREMAAAKQTMDQILGLNHTAGVPQGLQPQDLIAYVEATARVKAAEHQMGLAERQIDQERELRERELEIAAGRADSLKDMIQGAGAAILPALAERFTGGGDQNGGGGGGNGHAPAQAQDAPTAPIAPMVEFLCVHCRAPLSGAAWGPQGQKPLVTCPTCKGLFLLPDDALPPGEGAHPPPPRIQLPGANNGNGRHYPSHADGRVMRPITAPL